MKETLTITPETALTLMYGVIGRLKDMGGMYGDLRTIGIELHHIDMGVFNYVLVDCDMPEKAQWEDQVPEDSIRLVFCPPDGGERVTLCDIAGGFPHNVLRKPLTFSTVIE